MLFPCMPFTYMTFFSSSPSSVLCHFFPFFSTLTRGRREAGLGEEEGYKAFLFFIAASVVFPLPSPHPPICRDTTFPHWGLGPPADCQIFGYIYHSSYLNFQLIIVCSPLTQGL